MVSLNLICRFCLIIPENDCKKLLIRLTETQKCKFEELTQLELPLTDEYPLNVCTDCSDHLENFHFFKNQLIRKQNDLKVFLSSSKEQSNVLLEEAIHDDFIEFDEEIEIFSENIQTDNFIEDDDNLINEQLLQEDTSREELQFETINPKLILFPHDVVKDPEEITSQPESPLINYDDLLKCKTCNLRLKSQSSYEKHMKDNHEQNFICPSCGNIYVNKRDLKSHLRSHNFNKKYKCTYSDCTKAFRHQHHLKNHLRVHDKNSPFICNICNQSFRQKHALKLHTKKHNKDFIECETCKSQFIRPIQLKKHIENNLCDGNFKPYLTRNKKNNKD